MNSSGMKRPQSQRDSADTRRRILQAATEEFAARGLAGARIAAIAERAAANPRMLYAYYGSKDGLFRAVIESAVLAMQDAVDLDPADLVSYAVAVFDAYRSHPGLIRLALWQALEQPDLAHEIAPVREANARKIAVLEDAQRRGALPTALSAEELLDTVLTIVYGNFVLAGGIDNFTPARRATVARAVQALID